jgi:hypothetical protein
MSRSTHLDFYIRLCTEPTYQTGSRNSGETVPPLNLFTAGSKAKEDYIDFSQMTTALMTVIAGKNIDMRIEINRKFLVESSSCIFTISIKFLIDKVQSTVHYIEN